MAITLPALHDSAAGRDLHRAASDAPPEKAADLRAQARAVSRAEQRWIFAVAGMMAAVSGGVLVWRIYRCGGLGSALWHVHPASPSRP